MNWEQIRDMYLKACGQSQDALSERWDHIGVAYREIAASVQLPELHQPGAIVTTVSGQDYVDIDADVYSLDWIVNKTTGRKLDPEQGGSKGRSRFFESGQTRPPLGTVNFYVRWQNRIWLRDCPNAAVDLIVSFRFHPPDVTDAMLALHPVTPSQFDMAIVRWAAGSYFSIHPPTMQDGSADYSRGQQLISTVQSELAVLRSPVVEEQKDRRDYVRQPGYSFNVR